MNFLNETVGRFTTRLVLEFRSAEEDISQFGRRYKAEYGTDVKKEGPAIYAVPFEPDEKTALDHVVVLLMDLGYRVGKRYSDGSVDMLKRMWMAKVIRTDKDVIVGWIRYTSVKVPTSNWHPAKTQEPATQEQ